MLQSLDSLCKDFAFHRAVGAVVVRSTEVGYDAFSFNFNTDAHRFCKFCFRDAHVSLPKGCS